MTMVKKVSVGELFALNQQIMKLASRAGGSDVAEALAQAESFVTMAIRTVAYNDACSAFNDAQAPGNTGEKR